VTRTPLARLKGQGHRGGGILWRHPAQLVGIRKTFSHVNTLNIPHIPDKSTKQTASANCEADEEFCQLEGDL